MNWPIRTSVLFFFSFFALISCEDSNDIGLDGIGTEVQLGTSYTDTLTVKASTILANDSILAFRRGTTTFGHLLSGQLSNQSLGNVAAKSFLELAISSSTITGAAEAQIDSMVLALDYDVYYGDTTQTLALKVHKLTQPFKETETYFTTSSLTYEQSPIGSITFKPTPLRKVQFVPTGSNTTVTRSFPARIRLSNSLATQLMEQSGKTPLSSQAEFVKFFPGIAITADNNAKSVLGFNLASDSTYIRIYYKSGGTRQKYDLVIGNANNYFNNLSANRINSPLATLQQSGDSVSSANTGNQIFLQESLGIKSKISFPHLNKLKQALGDVAINKAELIMPVVSTSGTTPSPYLYLFETSKNNKIGNISIQGKAFPRAVSSDGAIYPSAYTSPTPLLYSEKNKMYNFNITSYLQAMLDGRKPNSGLIISPASVIASSQTGVAGTDLLAAQTLKQTILSMAPSNRIALRIYYTTKK